MLQLFLWYRVWYHTQNHDVIFITHTITSFIIIFIIYDIIFLCYKSIIYYDIIYVIVSAIYHIWYQICYHTWHYIFYPIWYYVLSCHTNISTAFSRLREPGSPGNFTVWLLASRAARLQARSDSAQPGRAAEGSESRWLAPWRPDPSCKWVDHRGWKGPGGCPGRPQSRTCERVQR